MLVAPSSRQAMKNDTGDISRSSSDRGQAIPKKIQNFSSSDRGHFKNRRKNSEKIQVRIGGTLKIAEKIRKKFKFGSEGL